MRKHAVAYCRVSSPKQAQTGDSLEDQERQMISLADRLDADIVPDGKVFLDPFSGRSNHRPGLDAALAYIRSHPGEVDYFLVLEIGRFTRGGTKSYVELKAELASYGVQLVDARGVIQPERNTLEHLGVEYSWSKVSPSEISETVIANQKKAEVVDLLTRLVGKEIQLVRAGYKTRPPLDGYINERIYVDEKKRAIHKADPARCHYFETIFDARASGASTDDEIVAKVNAMGFKTKEMNRWNATKQKIIGKSGGHPLTVKRLQKIIRNPAYCGVVCEKWTEYMPVRAAWPGLVTIDTFNKANRGKVFIKEHPDGSLELLRNVRPSIRNRNNPLYPYKRLVLCQECGKSFKGSASPGKSGKRYPGYHCSYQHGYRRYPKEEFESEIAKFIASLRPSQRFKDLLDDKLFKVYRRRQKELVQFSARVDINVSELKIRKEQALEAYLSANSDVVKRELEAKIDKLEGEIAQAQNVRKKVEISEYDVSAFIKHAKFLVEHLEKLLLDTDNPERQYALFGLVFEEPPTYQQIISGTPRLTLMFETKQPSRDEKAVLVTSKTLFSNLLLGGPDLCLILEEWNKPAVEEPEPEPVSERELVLIL